MNETFQHALPTDYVIICNGEEWSMNDRLLIRLHTSTSFSHQTSMYVKVHTNS